MRIYGKNVFPAAVCAVVLLSIAATSSAPARTALRLTVGENRLVSSDNAGRAHWEVELASDPADASHLIVCGIVGSPQFDRQYSTVVYTSRDGGAHWRATLRSGPMAWNSDCALAGKSVAYFVTMLRRDNRSHLEVFRSGDAGWHWQLVKRIIARDRPYLTILNRRICGEGYEVDYVAEGADTKGQTPMEILHVGRSGASNIISGDDSFAPDPRYGASDVVDPEPGVSLSDGSVGVVFGHRSITPMRPNQQLMFARLNACGSALRSISHITAAYASEHLFDESGWLPTLAQDEAREAFRGRLYVAWPDARYGGAVIAVAHSDDGGRTWSPPIIASDNSLDGSHESNAFLPAIAVNRSGIVGLLWYDTRNVSPDGVGWEIRFAASSDGGETFSASTRVSSGETRFDEREDMLQHLSNADYASFHSQDLAKFSPKAAVSATIGYNIRYDVTGGDTSGLAADRNGMFHAAWVDNRTGVSQVWTAPISVAGTIGRQMHAGPLRKLQTHRRLELEWMYPHSSMPALALPTPPAPRGFIDASGDVQLHVVSATLNARHSVVIMHCRLQNASSTALTLPLRLRIIALRSGFADVRFGASSRSARTVFTAFRLGGLKNLAPGQSTDVVAMPFRLKGFHVPRRGDILGWFDNVVSLWAKVYEGRPLART